MKKNIIIAGYPKSGTTWLSRLVAELLDCPLQGNWGFDNIDSPLKEGIDKISDFDCYKSHHLFEAFDTSKIFKIIYIVTDPRGVVISGTNFFNFSIQSMKKNSFKIPRPFSNRLVIHISKLVFPFSKKKKLMINAVLNGDESVNQWLKHSWKTHLQSFQKEDLLLIKYEDLKRNTLDKSIEILNYLEEERKESYIIESIEKQSIETKKTQYKNSNNKILKKTVNQGKSNYWIEKFDREEKQLFEHTISKELESLNYQTTK